jgi:hypothetical protein
VTTAPAPHFTLAGVIDGVAYAAILSSLALAVWAFVACALNKPPSNRLFYGFGMVLGLTAVVAVAAIVRLIGGAGPDNSDRVVTFIGYTITALAVPPAAVILARMEPTRAGSGLIGVAAVVLPVLILRMQQVWGG